MRRTAVWLVLAFLGGVLAAIGITAAVVRYSPQKVLSLVGAKLPAVQPAPVTQAPPSLSLVDQHQLGFQKSFGDIINDLQASRGYELDHLINVDQYTIGLLRKVSADTSSQDLKDLAFYRFLFSW